MRPLLALLSLAVALAAAPLGTAQAQTGHESGTTTRSLQGDDGAWRRDPHIKAFYAAVVEACRNGCSKADVSALEAKSRVIFGEFAASMHMSPAAMQDHLKLIPRQAVQIGAEDPKTLASFDNFLVAMFGPA